MTGAITGDIVGSIAEAAFNIPKEIYDKARGYLPTEMLNVVSNYYHKLNNRKQ